MAGALAKRKGEVVRLFVVGDAVGGPKRASASPKQFQSVMIIQPIDVPPDGRQNMCAGCPDVTAWNDRLEWSGHLDVLERLLIWISTFLYTPAPTFFSDDAKGCQ